MSEKDQEKMSNLPFLSDNWLIEQKKNEFVNKLKIVAGIVFIGLIVLAFVMSSPYLGFAAVLSLAIPEVGEKLRSLFLSMNDGPDANCPIIEENEGLNGEMENNSKTHQYQLFRERNEEEIVAQGNEADLTTKGRFTRTP
ncbi:MAG: hypothetical protein WAL30_06415 [Candidatus Aquirickettsiella sp.]